MNLRCLTLKQKYCNITKYDEKADAMYIKLKECKIFETKEIQDDIIIDLDVDGKLIGIEILDVLDKVNISDIANVNIRMLLEGDAEILQAVSS